MESNARGIRARRRIIVAVAGISSAVTLATAPSPAAEVATTSASTRVMEARFAEAAYGDLPDGWVDQMPDRPSRNWIVDGNGFLRMTKKPATGVIAYAGGDARSLADATLTATFKKTEEESISFGVAGRIQDGRNFYLARFTGADRLELLKVKDGVATPFDLTKPGNEAEPRTPGLVTIRRYHEGEQWTLSLTLRGDRLTARVVDDKGVEQARLDAVDADFAAGLPGLSCTRFASASSFAIDAGPTTRPTMQGAIAVARPHYPIVKPEFKHELVDTPRDKVAPSYDVIVAGGGTGGFGAAIQAARSGARVLLIEESEWLGGQMSAAAVGTMDEDGLWGKFPVRERGIYREFNESMVAYYQTLEKDPFVAYYSYPRQEEGGYEPKASRAVLYGFIREARARGATLDVSLRSRVVEVAKTGKAVTGATIEFGDESGATKKSVACKVLIDATEYGDVIPLTGARYRTGNVTSDAPNPKALVQDHTWLAVVKEYPGGVPEELRIKSPPPGYEEVAAKKYKNYQLHGNMLWGGAGKGIKGNKSWRVYFAWRGMADTDSPLTGERSNGRHTQCGFNGGNDYPVTSGTLEDPKRRLIDEREGIYRTLGALYYFQQLGVNWSLAVDEGFDTPYNRAKMKERDLRPDLAALAVHLPQLPYVRESRRIVGVKTLVANDLTRFEKAKLMPTAVAMGDYFMDLDHGETSKAIEPDLDTHDSPRGGGPFQVPFEVFIPEAIDGFVPAEKNIAQSRIANGATRLQPITMLTGQAAGMIAALAARENVQPRALDPRRVQGALLDAGCTLIQRWHEDVPWRTPIWKATQLCSLYQVMDRAGPINGQRPWLAAGFPWGVDEPLKRDELNGAINRLAELRGTPSQKPVGGSGAVTWDELVSALGTADPSWAKAADGVKPFDPTNVRAGEFAIVASRILAP